MQSYGEKYSRLPVLNFKIINANANVYRIEAFQVVCVCSTLAAEARRRRFTRRHNRTRISSAFGSNAPETAVTAAISTSVRKRFTKQATAFLKCYAIMVQKLAWNIRFNTTEIGHVVFILSSRIWHRHRQLIYRYWQRQRIYDGL